MASWQLTTLPFVGFRGGGGRHGAERALRAAAELPAAAHRRELVPVQMSSCGTQRGGKGSAESVSKVSLEMSPRLPRISKAPAKCLRRVLGVARETKSVSQVSLRDKSVSQVSLGDKKCLSETL